MTDENKIKCDDCSGDDRYFSLQLDVPAYLSDLMIGVFYSLGARGMQTLADDLLTLPGVDLPEPGFERITAYFPNDGSLDRAELARKVRQYIAAVPVGMGQGEASSEVNFQDVEDTDWSRLFRSFFKPLAVGKRLFIRPSWEVQEPGRARMEIVMDPGMAFGTGTHETTRLCLEWLEPRVKGAKVLDVGAGSGILSIAAAKLGASHVCAVENDPVALEVARRNMGLNRVSDQVELLDKIELVQGKYQVVLANILAHTLIDLAGDIVSLMDSGSELALSGVLAEQKTQVSGEYGRHGLMQVEVRNITPWVLIGMRLD